MKFETMISASMTGLDGLFSTEKIFEIVQDFVTVTFEDMGLDNITMTTKYHSMWVVTKNKARIIRRPKWNEHLSVNCRVVYLGKLLSYTRTSFYDDKNNLVMDSIAEFCIIDKDTFKFVRLENYPIVVEEDGSIERYEFLDTSYDEEFDVKVTAPICDLLHHMNNAKAMQPIFSNMSFESYQLIQEHETEITIKYASQAFMGSKIKLYLKETPKVIYFQYVDQNDKLLEIGQIEILN